MDGVVAPHERRAAVADPLPQEPVALEAQRGVLERRALQRVRTVVVPEVDGPGLHRHPHEVGVPRHRLQETAAGVEVQLEVVGPEPDVVGVEQRRDGAKRQVLVPVQRCPGAAERGGRGLALVGVEQRDERHAEVVGRVDCLADRPHVETGVGGHAGAQVGVLLEVLGPAVLPEDRRLGPVVGGHQRLVELLDLVVQALQATVDPQDDELAARHHEPLVGHQVGDERRHGVVAVDRDDQVDLPPAVEEDVLFDDGAVVVELLAVELDAVRLLGALPVRREVAAQPDVDPVAPALGDERARHPGAHLLAHHADPARLGGPVLEPRDALGRELEVVDRQAGVDEEVRAAERVQHAVGEGEVAVAGHQPAGALGDGGRVGEGGKADDADREDAEQGLGQPRPDPLKRSRKAPAERGQAA